MPLIRRLLHSLCALAVLSLPARAEPLIPGETTPEFLSATQQWLAGDDLNALTSLSLLAQSGNKAAQILLARIASNGYLHGHVTTLLARKDRTALLRQPGGLSGKSWLEAARDIPLADAFLNLGVPEQSAAAAETLLQCGELDETQRVLMALVNRGQPQDALDIIDKSTDFPGSAQAVVDSAKFSLLMASDDDWEITSKSLADLLVPKSPASEIVQLTWSPATTRDLLENETAHARAVEFTAQVPSLQPLRQFCETYCPTSIDTCAAAGAATLPSKSFQFASPVQSLIPNDVYWASPRMNGDVLRLFDKSVPLDPLETIDACFVETVERLRLER